jgi:hypothetical protein
MPPISAVRLFRAVSPSELADLLSYGIFRPIPSSNQGKWFAETQKDATEWGRSLSSIGAGVFQLIQVDVPQSVADSMFRIVSLDQIGPARYAEGDVLDLVNQTHLGIAEVSLTALGGS